MGLYQIFMTCSLLLSTCILAEEAKIKVEDGIYVLTDNVFDNFIKSHTLVLAEFYAPWCGHCKELAPEYSAAAQILKESQPEAKLAKIDATVEKELAADFDVEGFPTVKVFKNGHLVGDFQGREKEEIVEYVTGKMGPSTVEVKDVSEWNAFVEANDVAVIGLFEDLTSETADEFKAMADVSDDASFALSSNAELLSELKVGFNSVVLIKEDGRSDYAGDLKAEDLKSYVAAESLPYVHTLTLKTSEKIFTLPIKRHMILYHKGPEGLADLKTCFKDAAMAYAGDVLFVTADTQLEFSKNSMPYFDVQEDTVASLRAIDLDKDLKYRATDPTTCAIIKETVDGFVAGKLEPMEDTEEDDDHDHDHEDGEGAHKEEPLPADWDAKPVKVVVASNFEDVVNDPEKAVFLKLYADWCGHCQQLAPVWQELAEVFQENEDLVIAEVNADKNTVPVKFQGFPTILYYPAGENKKSEEYSGGRAVRDLTEFLAKKGFDADEFSEMEMMADVDAPEPDEHNVYHLNDDTFDDFIDDHDIVLVAFTAPWCGHCKKLHPQWNEAATYLGKEDSEAKMAWIDATTNREIAEDFEVNSYPTLKFFRNGVMSDYHLGTEAIEIVSFLGRQSGPPAVTITSVKAYDDVVANNNVVTFGVFSDLDGNEAHAFIELAAGSIGKFCLTDDEQVMGKLGLSPDVTEAVVLIKNFDDGRAVYDGSYNDVAQLKAFVKESGMPLVIEYSEGVMNMIFENEVKTHIILFHDDKGGLKPFEQCFADVARKHRGKMLFITVAIPDEHSDGPVKYFKVQDTDKAVIRAVTTEPDNTRYHPATDDITCDTIATFVQDFADGKIEAQPKDPKPAKTEEEGHDETASHEHVEVLTKDTFHAVVNDPTKDVFVLMYADWCGHCKAMKPAYHELAGLYEGIEDLVIAKINADTSRPEGVEIEGYPTVKLFPKNGKDPVEFMGKRTVKAMVKFLADETGAQAKLEEGDAESDQSTTTTATDKPLVWKFSPENEDALFEGDIQKHCLLFHNDEGLVEFQDCFTEAAKKYNTHMHFVTVDKNTEAAAPPMKFFGLVPDNKADLRLINSASGNKYPAPEGKVTCAMFMEYAQSIVDGKVEEITDDDEGHGHSHDGEHGHSHDAEDAHDEL